MTPIVTNKLTFISRDLGIDVELLLTFDDQPVVGMYKDYYPSAFELAFSKAVVSDDVIQSASTVVPINVGQYTILTLGNDIYHLSDPKTDPSVPKKSIQCTNNAPFREDIGVGFIERDGGMPKTALVWRGIGHGQTLNAEFKPVLRGYINTDLYREDDLIKRAIQHDRLFDKDLTALDRRTTWVITYDKSQGVFSIDEEIKSEVQELR
ncbi:uncharacterized protein EDB93DRAFT_1255340 [Suillus bovinus]|uniref:uncharacterized protein n=1 Tax=Suillus bovinus TaxID=48563 RepID=UPI001B85ED6F|nr:uncharacterized protein EDB93DRAFT_1255340 [Suillus bovinus]KAG2132155.1 hypothetical protein EDB93DRAFT_1255340 [Suillus bovinus]